MTTEPTAAAAAFDDFLETESREALRRAITEWSERNGLSDPVGSQHLPEEELGEFELPPSLSEEIADRIERLVPLVRQRLGIPHFAIGEPAFAVGLHGSRTSVHSRPSAHPTGPRRVDFILHLDAGPESFTGGELTIAGVGSADDAERFTPDDNRIVFFPSDRDHEIEATKSTTAQPRRYSLWGWIAEQDGARTLVARDRQAGKESQPTVPLLSDAGFEVRPTPPAVHQLLRSLLELRSSQARQERADATYHLGPDNDFIDAQDVADDVLRALQPIHETFAGVPLLPSVMYGLRIYRAGATLRMHRDRSQTHVISSVLQIAQDVDEPWPLELDVGGTVHQVLLSPGQMVLYEGAACAHGRPEPLAGRSFVNVFVHYRPVDWPLGVGARGER